MRPSIIQNRYLLHEVIGAGGMGVVYRATDRMTQADVALKRVSARAHDFGLHHTNDFERELSTEFRLLATLYHPNIIPVMDFGLDADRQPFYTMRLLQHPRTILDAGQHVGLDGRLRLLCQALRALTYLHRRGVMHRDLKPSNLLVEDETVFLLDFGLALQQLNAHGDVGTLLYAAPESISANATSLASDIYALGVLAFQLFEGGDPYDLPAEAPYATIVEAIKHQPVPSQRLFSHADESLVPAATADAIRALVNSMVQKNPAHRATDARALLYRFAELVDESVAQEAIFLLEMPQLVGRQQELSAVKVALETVQTATRDVWAFVKASPSATIGSAWLIGGEGGVGKTRLLQEISLEALTRGFLVLRGQQTDTSALPYHAWHNPIRHLVLHSPPDAPQLSILQRIVPHLSDLMNTDALPVAHDDYTQQRVITTVVNLFQGLNQPTLLLLEDLHLAEDSIALLNALSMVVEQLPLVIIATYRDDEHPKLHHQLPHLRHISLKRLTATEIAQLSRNIIGQPILDPGLTTWLAEQTEGNPFFLIETLRTLAEQAGDLENIPHQPRPDHLLPRGLEPLISQRLQKISEIDRDLLYIAAVIGRELDLTMLAPFSDTLSRWLVRCANAHVLDFEDGVWRFSHEKLREGLLMWLDPHYLQIARWCAIVAYETTYPNDPSKAAQLFDLYQQVGAPAEARQYALQAADLAAASSDLDGAIGWYEKAFSISDADPGPQVLLRYATTLVGRDQIHAALPVIDAVQAHPDKSPQVEAATNALQATAMLKLQYYLSALHYGMQAVLQYRALDDSPATARAMLSVGNAYRALGNFREARHFHTDMLNYFSAQQNVVGQGRALAQLGIDAYLVGDLALASDLIATATPLAESTNDVALQAQLANQAGVIYHAQGRYFGAISRLQQSQHMATTLHDHALIAFNHVKIGHAHLALRDHATSREHYVFALRMAHALSATHPVVMEAVVGLAHLYLHQDHHHERAATWLHLINDHPLTTADVRLLIQQIREHHAELPAPANPRPTFEDVIVGLLLR